MKITGFFRHLLTYLKQKLQSPYKAIVNFYKAEKLAWHFALQCESVAHYLRNQAKNLKTKLQNHDEILEKQLDFILLFL